MSGYQQEASPSPERRLTSRSTPPLKTSRRPGVVNSASFAKVRIGIRRVDLAIARHRLYEMTCVVSGGAFNSTHSLADLDFLVYRVTKNVQFKCVVEDVKSTL